MVYPEDIGKTIYLERRYTFGTCNLKLTMPDGTVFVAVNKADEYAAIIELGDQIKQHLKNKDN